MRFRSVFPARLRPRRPTARTSAMSSAEVQGPSVDRVLIAAPPRRAVGGVAAYTAAVVAGMPESRAFDQWWPLRKRSTSRVVRTCVHVGGLARWVLHLGLRRPDVIHLQVTSPGLPRDLVYLRLAQAAGVPVVAHMHTSGFVGPDVAPGIQARVGRILEAVDGVVVMSETAAAGFVAQYGLSRERLHVVPNPAPEMSAPDVSRPAARPCRFLCVGEISVLKGQVPLARAAEALAREGIECEVALVGPISTLPVAEVDYLRASPQVVLRGVKRGEELAAEFARSDAFALFSFTEAEPLAMLEAMAMGLPVIATDVGSIPDALAAAGSGNELVPAGDEGALREAMRRMCLDEADRRETGARNREWATTDRSLPRHVESLRGVYRDVLRAPRRASTARRRTA